MAINGAEYSLGVSFLREPLFGGLAGHQKDNPNFLVGGPKSHPAQWPVIDSRHS